MSYATEDLIIQEVGKKMLNSNLKSLNTYLSKIVDQFFGKEIDKIEDYQESHGFFLFVGKKENQENWAKLLIQFLDSLCRPESRFQYFYSASDGAYVIYHQDHLWFSSFYLMSLESKNGAYLNMKSAVAPVSLIVSSKACATSFSSFYPTFFRLFLWTFITKAKNFGCFSLIVIVPALKTVLSKWNHQRNLWDTYLSLMNSLAHHNFTFFAYEGEASNFTELKKLASILSSLSQTSFCNLYQLKMEDRFIPKLNETLIQVINGAPLWNTKKVGFVSFNNYLSSQFKIYVNEDPKNKPATLKGLQMSSNNKSPLNPLLLLELQIMSRANLLNIDFTKNLESVNFQVVDQKFEIPTASFLNFENEDIWQQYDANLSQ